MGGKGTRRRFTGLIGVHCAPLNLLEVWGSEIFRKSIMLCWQNRFGNYFTIRILCFNKFLVLNTSLMVIFWMLRSTLIAPLHGEVFCKPLRLSIEVLYGGWETGYLLIYGTIDGYLNMERARLFLHSKVQRSVECMDYSI